MKNKEQLGLDRHLNLLTLTATGICSMVGASIYVVPIMIQKNVPGIGPYVLFAFLIAAVPALLAALSYAALASAMPEAGGSYVYVSRSIHPYLGFVASFSQWFGLSLVIGVVAFVTIPFFRDFFEAIGFKEIAVLFSRPEVRLLLALFILGFFTYTNLKGGQFYRHTLVPLMFLMFILGGLVIFFGFYFDKNDFSQALLLKNGILPNEVTGFKGNWQTLFTGASILFASFIGFDSIAQAGGEAKNPNRNLPRAIILSVTIVGLYYFIFSAAVYHSIPWWYIAEEAKNRDLTAPGLFSILLNPFWSSVILLGAAIALLNDLPGMILSVSRLLFAWAKDGIISPFFAAIHPISKTPQRAVFFSSFISALGIFGCHFAGDIFLGIDIMVTSMLVNFILICLSVVLLPSKNKVLAEKMNGFNAPDLRNVLAVTGLVLLVALLVIHTIKDTNNHLNPWYFKATWVWLLVMSIGSIWFFSFWIKNKNGKSHFLEPPGGYDRE
jgi:amino acid transporter